MEAVFEERKAQHKKTRRSHPKKGFRQHHVGNGREYIVYVHVLTPPPKKQTRKIHFTVTFSNYPLVRGGFVKAKEAFALALLLSPTWATRMGQELAYFKCAYKP